MLLASHKTERHTIGIRQFYKIPILNILTIWKSEIKKIKALSEIKIGETEQLHQRIQIEEITQLHTVPLKWANTEDNVIETPSAV